MALLVVDGLEPVDVDVGGYEASFALSAGAFHFVVKVFQADSSSPRAGELVDPGLLAVVGGLVSIALRMGTVTGGLVAVTPRLGAIAPGVRSISGGLGAVAPRPGAVPRRPTAGRPTAAAQLFHAQGVPVGEVVLGVEVYGFAVVALSRLVAQDRQFVAKLCGDVSLLGRSIAPTRVLLTILGLLGALSGRLCATGPFLAMGVVRVGPLITVALGLIAVAERLLRICTPSFRVVETLLSHVWTLLPLKAESGHRLLTHLADRWAEEPTDEKLGRRPHGR